MRHLTRKTKESLYYALQRLADKGIVKPNIYLSDEDMSEILVEMGPLGQEEYETFGQDAKRYLQDCVSEGKFDEILSDFRYRGPISYRNPCYGRRNPLGTIPQRVEKYRPRYRNPYYSRRNSLNIDARYISHRERLYPMVSDKFLPSTHTRRRPRPTRNPLPAFLSAGIISDAIKEIRKEKGGHRFRPLSLRAWARVIRKLSKKYNMEEKAVERILRTLPENWKGKAL